MLISIKRSIQEEAQGNNQYREWCKLSGFFQTGILNFKLCPYSSLKCIYHSVFFKTVIDLEGGKNLRKNFFKKIFIYFFSFLFSEVLYLTCVYYCCTLPF